jgi:hypothetical protein
MRYPQAYVLIDREYEMPPAATIQGWCSSKSPVYIQGVSERNLSMEERINAILEIHGHLDSKSRYSNQVVVFNGKKVGHFLAIAAGNYLNKVYWIDSSKHASSILRVRNAIDTAITFQFHLHEAHEAYWQVSKFISRHTGDKPYRDEQIDRLFQSRMWGDRSTAEHHLKRIAKNETRAGILNRLDL